MKKAAISVAGLLLAVLLGLIWLALLASHEAVLPALRPLVPPLLVLLLVYLHLQRNWPRRLAHGSLKAPPPGTVLWTLAVALALTGAQIVLALAGIAARNPGVPPLLEALPDPVTLAMAIAVAPLVEELALRRWLQGELSRWLPVPAAVCFAAGLFALAHGPQWPAHLLSGLVYGALFALTGNFWIPVLAHVLHNALVGFISWPPVSAWSFALVAGWSPWQRGLLAGLLLVVGLVLLTAGSRLFRAGPAGRKR